MKNFSQSITFLGLFVLVSGLVSALRGFPAAGEELFVDILFFTGSLVLAALITAIVFEVTYALIWFSGSLLMRSGMLWTYLAPAIAVFFLLAEPILRLPYSWNAPGVPLLAVIASIAGMGFLLFMPVFRGLMSSFFVGAVFIGRFLTLPVLPEETILSTFIFIVLNSVLAGIFFLAFQVRRRLPLSEGYERFAVPRKQIQFSALILLVLTVLYFLIGLLPGPYFSTFRNSIFQADALLNFSRSAYFFIFYIGLVFLAYQLLGSIILRKRAYRPGISYVKRWIVVLPLVLLFSLTGILFRSADNMHRLALAGGPLLEYYSFTGRLLDLDRDGNSLWPGKDPGPRNNLIRSDFSVNPEMAPRDSNRIIESLSTAPDRIIVVTTTGLGLPESGQILLTPFDSIEANLRSLWKGMDGFQERQRTDPRSMLSYLVEAGYRTLCTGSGGDYFQPAAESGLDRGCQVMQPMEFPEPDRITEYFQEIRSFYFSYREDKTLIWIHLDWAAAGRSLQSEKSKSEIQTSLNHLMNVIQSEDSSSHTLYFQKDPVPVVSINNQPAVSVSHLPFSNLLFYLPVASTDSLSADRIAQLLDSQIKTGQEQTINFLEERPYTDFWAAGYTGHLFSESAFPSISMRMARGSRTSHVEVEFFDGILGSKWTKVFRYSD